MGRVIRNYFNMLCACDFNYKQTSFFKFLNQKLKDVTMKGYIQSLSNLCIDISALRLMNLQKNQCYSNAANICIFGNVLNKNPVLYEILYCEGFVTTHDLVIEHAWNCVVDKFSGTKTYFDITFEYVLDYNLQTINKEDYCVVHEYNLKELNALRLETMCAGPYLQEIFQKQI